jgi:hypothetical protein
MNRLTVTDVDSNMGHTHATVLVVDQVSGLCISRADRWAKAEVSGRPAVEVDSGCG